MILFDPSVWVDYWNRLDTPQVQKLVNALDSGEALVCPTIIQEVLQGIRDDRPFTTVQERLVLLPCLHLPPIEAAVAAANLYRMVRKKGVTIRKPNDCLIAYYAIQHGVEICHHDRDFDLIAQHSRLKISPLQ
ncbi:MAG: PIN domain-containing protein [Sphingobacteriaceae bacterium]|nr:PIN domain-containing protein [Cytophagaceae bacterium]